MLIENPFHHWIYTFYLGLLFWRYYSFWTDHPEGVDVYTCHITMPGNKAIPRIDGMYFLEADHNVQSVTDE